MTENSDTSFMLTYIIIGTNISSITHLPLIMRTKIRRSQGRSDYAVIELLQKHRDMFYPQAIYRIRLNARYEPQLTINYKAVADWFSMRHMLISLRLELDQKRTGLEML
jgi:hypothetical protein